MKKYSTFKDWVEDQSSQHQKWIGIIALLIQKASPSLTESVKWGNGCWLGEKHPVIYLHAKKDHLQLGFFAGALLKDPKHLLEGSGKFLRHVKIRSARDIDRKVFSKWVREATRTRYRD